MNIHRAPGNWCRGAARCKTCPILIAKDKLASNMTSQRYKVKGNASCTSSNVIYLIECKRCGNQNIGETGQPLHCGMNSHRSDIAHQRIDESPVVVHFNNMAHSLRNMAAMVTDQLHSLDPTLWKIRESR